MQHDSLPPPDPAESPDELDDETFERAAERRRSSPREPDDDAPAQYEPGMGEDEHGDAPGASPAPHETVAPPADPRVGAVPETTARPGESDGQAAARLGRAGHQDAWGEPEDRPDHDRNEVYVQQDESRSQC